MKKILDLLQKIFWHQKMRGDLAHKTAMYPDIHENLSTRSTTQIYARGAFTVSLLIAALVTGMSLNATDKNLHEDKEDSLSTAVFEGGLKLAGNLIGTGVGAAFGGFLGGGFSHCVLPSCSHGSCACSAMPGMILGGAAGGALGSWFATGFSFDWIPGVCIGAALATLYADKGLKLGVPVK